MSLLLGILQLVIVLSDVVLFEVTKHKPPVLFANLFLQCRGCVEHDLELAAHLCNLLVGFDKILCMQIPVHADSIIQVLLLIALCLDICYLLLELGQHGIASLEFLQGSEVLGICLCQFHAVLLALLVQLEDSLLEFLRILLPPSNVLHQVQRMRFLPLDDVDLLLGALISLYDILVQDVALPEQVFDLFAIDISILLLRINRLLHLLELIF
mmetsp:Transcript_42898/g.100680  ORF Transcript_42898/g.100680 Transcript_42898/m.100680 type:complete len:212 (-) Transcript_42898:1189-1824(-)